MVKSTTFTTDFSVGDEVWVIYDKQTEHECDVCNGEGNLYSEIQNYAYGCPFCSLGMIRSQPFKSIACATVKTIVIQQDIEMESDEIKTSILYYVENEDFGHGIPSENVFPSRSDVITAMNEEDEGK